MTGQSMYYLRVMMRNLAQVLTKEYSEHGVHVATLSSTTRSTRP
jgi:hypothetical protein